MTKTNIWLTVGGVLLLAAVVLGFVKLWFLSGARDVRGGSAAVVTRLMQRKAAAAAQIAGGLAKQDFARAERGVSELRRVGAASNWYVPDERYRQRSDAYRQALDQLADTLAARDAVAAQAAYNAVVDSCNACHRQASAPPVDMRGVSAE